MAIGLATAMQEMANRLSGWQHGSGGCWPVKPIPSTAQAGPDLKVLHAG